jgi:hypothetical protein
LLSDRIKLDDINEGFERLRVSDVVRQVVVFDRARHGRAGMTEKSAATDAAAYGSSSVSQ